jgi:hypothetical protein
MNYTSRFCQIGVGRCTQCFFLSNSSDASLKIEGI